MHVGTAYRSTVRATIPKHVKCENCGCEFVYLRTAAADGEGFSALSLSPNSTQCAAASRAVAKLNKLLRQCDPVACPDCGIYQADMVRLLKKLKWRTVRALGLLTILFHIGIMGAVAALQADQPLQGYLSVFAFPHLYVFLAGAALLAFGWTLRARYEPNADAAQRAGRVPVTAAGPFRREEYDRLEAGRKQSVDATVGAIDLGA